LTDFSFPWNPSIALDDSDFLRRQDIEIIDEAVDAPVGVGDLTLEGCPATTARCPAIFPLAVFT